MYYCNNVILYFRAQYAGNGATAFSSTKVATATAAATSSTNGGIYLTGNGNRGNTLIPSYQGNGNGRVYHQARINSDQQQSIPNKLLANEASTSTATYLQRCHQRQQQQQPSQLPQPISTKLYETSNHQQQPHHHHFYHGQDQNNYQDGEGHGFSISNSNTRGISGYYLSGSGSSSSATSSSPLSPPSVSNYSVVSGNSSTKDETKSLALNELSKLCRKSPFLQRRNGCNVNAPSTTSPAGNKFHSPGDESPKKDQSMLSSIGKKNLENLILN